MQDWVIKKCLGQLSKIYVYCEIQYAHSASHATSPIMKRFFRQRAFERSDFIFQILQEMKCIEKNYYRGISIDDFYNWHSALYGNSLLSRRATTDINLLNIDEKALEICNCMLSEAFPLKIKQVITKQKALLESSLLSFTYLKGLYEDKQF